MSQPLWGRIYTETLPSGTRARVKRISNLHLLWAGGFPTELTGLVWKMANQEVDVKKLTEDPDPEGLRRMVGIIEHVVPHALVSPQVGERTELVVGEDGVTQGTVTMIDISDLDKQWLLLFSQGLIRSEDERAEVGAKPGPESFRDESVRADVGSSGPTVQPAAVSDGGVAS